MDHEIQALQPEFPGAAPAAEREAKN